MVRLPELLLSQPNYLVRHRFYRSGAQRFRVRLVPNLPRILLLSSLLCLSSCSAPWDSAGITQVCRSCAATVEILSLRALCTILVLTPQSTPVRYGAVDVHGWERWRGSFSTEKVVPLILESVLSLKFSMLSCPVARNRWCENSAMGRHITLDSLWCLVATSCKRLSIFNMLWPTKSFM